MLQEKWTCRLDQLVGRKICPLYILGLMLLALGVLGYPMKQTQKVVDALLQVAEFKRSLVSL